MHSVGFSAADAEDKKDRFVLRPLGIHTPDTIINEAVRNSCVLSRLNSLLLTLATTG